jgi:hypothetical protein
MDAAGRAIDEQDLIAALTARIARLEAELRTRDAFVRALGLAASAEKMVKVELREGEVDFTLRASLPAFLDAQTQVQALREMMAEEARARSTPPPAARSS